MSSNDCIFCKIINNELPSKKIHESENVLAFLDAFPISKGHFLVISKSHAEKLHLVPDAALQEMLVVAKHLIIKSGLSNYNLLQNNGTLAHQFVFHVHIHVIPKHSDQDGLVMSWNAKKATEEELENSLSLFS